ncbi:MAG TPA: hypothetical protein GX710_04550, partial [Clostridiales bacterium]|nr:hypothetical protein [Clostridiales bacterium]
MKEGLNIKLAEQVLEYWFLTEFLAQDKYPEFKNQDVVSELKDKQNNKKRNYYFLEDKLCLKRDSCINVYEAISNEASDCGMECWSDATIYIGKVKRSDCIESIAKIINYTNDSPEKDDTKIALISLQVSPEGKYKEHSLSISPIVWALSMIKKNSRDISGAISIDVYKEIVESIEKQFFLNDDDKDKVVSLEKLEQLLLKVYSDYL